MKDVDVAGETLTLLAERAVLWRKHATLLVADPHFGKAASFRSLGVFVPSGTTEDGLTRLDHLIAAHDVHRIVFLGDFLHAREGRNERTFATIEAWRERHVSVDMSIVRGNHDRRAGDPPESLRMRCENGPVPAGPFALAHHPMRVENAYVLAGHIHPCAVLTGSARQRERLQCFHFAAGVGILPAFGDFTGCAEIVTGEADRVWVIADGDVVMVR